MNKVWCPICHQGWVLLARITVSGELIQYCQECEVCWYGTKRVEVPPDSTVWEVFDKLGRKPTKSDIEIIETN